MKIKYLFISLFLVLQGCGEKKEAKQQPEKRSQEELRGSITPERSWWDVQRYDIAITPDFDTKSLTGSNKITYKVVEKDHSDYMQIDLQPPLKIDSVFSDDNKNLSFTSDGNVWYIETGKQAEDQENSLTVYYSGNPREAVRAPWDGGWTFTRDSLNRPWMTVTCQGLGASVWYPNKDHQSDEPDQGASLAMTVPDDLTAIANGRLSGKTSANGKTTYTWEVKNPVNNYNIIPYIGYYVNFGETYPGEKGELNIDYWVLDYNLEKARVYLPAQVHNMLKSFEYWFGPYPFYEDGYKLVETEHTGMEHQSAIAYGNHYKPGYRGRDASGTGLGMEWDFIIIHESGHEWFGNNITSNDLADMYVHESFTNYSETLFVESMFGKEAGNQYNYGIRKGIQNDTPIIPEYGINAKGSGDMYPKGGNMLHTVRHSINNDTLFREILTGLNSTFYHRTVDGVEILDYISQKAGYDYSRVFEQYLTTTQIPLLELHYDSDKKEMHYRWGDIVKGFDLPLSLQNKKAEIRIIPSGEWQSVKVDEDQRALFLPEAIEKMYYIRVKETDVLP
ncbi:Peptidase family M1 [Sinomicrobium oceani]|uniref:Peptidase family M1 n=1 Tax=Sinomicrobium oceani TaxID=1150368 RepID=A0A1K1QZZ8_9FLAO|nr:M1 family metallopeptidase [Sinomicrobium oceani]SFW65522.1 Peptidase family M1 [Sinomicrobium oceani]